MPTVNLLGHPFTEHFMHFDCQLTTLLYSEILMYMYVCGAIDLAELRSNKRK